MSRAQTLVSNNISILVWGNNSDDIFMKEKECDTVIYKKYTSGHRYLVFIHRSWTTAPKALGISWAKRAVGTSFVIMFGLLSWSPEVTSNPWRWNRYSVIHNQPLSMTTRFMSMSWFLESTQGWGLVTRETNHAQKAGTFSSTPDFWEGEKGWRSNHNQGPIIWSTMPMW